MSCIQLLTPDEPKEVIDEGEQLEGEDKPLAEHGTSAAKPSEKMSAGEASVVESSKCVAAASERRSEDNAIGRVFDHTDSSGLRYRGPVVPR